MSGARSLGRAAPWVFLGLTLAYTWAFLVAAAVTGRGWLELPTILIGGVGLLGPSVVATALVWRGRYRQSVRGFWRRVVDSRIPPRWYGAVVAIAVLPYLAARLIYGGTGAGVVAAAPSAGFIAISVAAGLVEEPGWRGYAQDGLQRRRPVLLAALVVGMVWAVWHLPLYLIEGTFQHGVGLGTREFWLLSGATVVQSVIYAWIYLGTAGSIFAVVLFHALQDVAGEVFSLDGAEGVELALWAGVAAVLMILVPRMRAPAPN